MGLYRGYIRIMEKKMETTIRGSSDFGYLVCVAQAWFLKSTYIIPVSMSFCMFFSI